MSQPIIFKCSACQQRLQVKPLATVSQVTCPHCQSVLRIAAVKSPKVAQGIAPQPINPQGKTTSGFDIPKTPMSGPSNRLQVQRTAGAAGKSANAMKAPLLIFGTVSALITLGLIIGGTLMLLSPSDTEPSTTAELAPSSSAPESSKATSVRPTKPSGPTKPTEASGPAFAKVPVTPYQFSDLGEPLKVYASGVKRYFVEIDLTGQRSAGKMQFHVYLPAGEHPERSLPSVLVAPAGTNLLHGASLSRSDEYDKETLPYAEAGMVAVQYSLDGGLPDGFNPDGPNAMESLVQAYPKFASAGAGVANAMRAREFVLQKIKMTAPEKLFFAGHSSAANVALLTSSRLGRQIGGCVSYAGAYDLQARLAGLTRDPTGARLFRNINMFVITNSPQTKANLFRCPVFVFHARDDSNVPLEHAQAFVAALKKAKTDVTFETVVAGGHYTPMIQSGIPKAIQWIRKQTS